MESRYDRETARILKKAVAHTLYRGLPNSDTLKEIKYRSGKTTVMARAFNVNSNQMNGWGTTLLSKPEPSFTSKTFVCRREAKRGCWMHTI
ncbi:hypothetical protein ACYQR9_15385 [Methylobacterium sp. CM6241]